MTKKEVREKFRNGVLSRDSFECKLCHKVNVKLDAHHITNRGEMPNFGYVLSNGITLCDNGEEGCHFKVEKFYFSEERDNDLNHPYHPDNLYKLIGSYKEKAILDDIKSNLFKK